MPFYPVYTVLKLGMQYAGWVREMTRCFSVLCRFVART